MTMQTPNETKTEDDFSNIKPVKRAPFNYYGGKQRLAKRISPFVPYTRIYVEPFCGGASLFFRRNPSPVEVLNDLDNRIVNFFRVLQDDTLYEKLSHMLRWTPYSFSEFKRALKLMNDETANNVVSAWAWFVCQNQSISAAPRSPGNWCRSFTSSRDMGLPISAWKSKIDMLQKFHERITRAYIDNRDAIECINYWDSPQTTFYCDPPYHHETRKGLKTVYGKECDNQYHERLTETLLNIKGAAVLSSYDHSVYAPLEKHGWHKVIFSTVATAATSRRSGQIHGAGAAKKHAARKETLWVNPRAMQLIK